MAEFLPFDGVSSSPHANSYATLEWADDYVANRGGSADAWESGADADKKAALISATAELETYVYVGYELTPWQKLKWPRTVDDARTVQVTVSANGGRTIGASQITQKPAFPPNTWNGGGLVFEEPTEDQYYEAYAIEDYDYTAGTVTVSADFSSVPAVGQKPTLVTPIPTPVRAAAVELALVAIEQTSGASDVVKRIEMGPGEIEYAGASGSLMANSPNAFRLIEPFRKKAFSMPTSAYFR